MTQKLMAFISVVLLAVTLLAPGSRTLAQDDSQRDPEFEQAIYDTLAATNPDAVPLFVSATEALDSNNLEAAQQGYLDVLALVPGNTDTLRRLSYVESEMGDHTSAINRAREAYELDSSVINQVAVAQALVFSEDAANWREGLQLAQSGVNAEPDDPYNQWVLLVAGAQTENIEVMRDASNALIELAPDDAMGHFYRGLVAAEEGDWQLAERELIRARDLGWPAAEVDELLNNDISSQASRQRLEQTLPRLALQVFGTWFAGLVTLFLLGVLLSRMTLAAVNRAQTTGSLAPTQTERNVRSAYRLVISVSAIYCL